MKFSELPNRTAFKFAGDARIYVKLSSNTYMYESAEELIERFGAERFTFDILQTCKHLPNPLHVLTVPAWQWCIA